jgi:negative regulator of replication initiation
MSPVNIKSQHVEYNDKDFNYIKEFVKKCEEVLFSDYFVDKERGWQKYMDMQSFVD